MAYWCGSGRPSRPGHRRPAGWPSVGSVPTFFVPAATTEEQAEQLWQTTRSFLAAYGHRTTERRIFRLDFGHKGESYIAEIGQPERRVTAGREMPTGEPVLVILEGEGGGLFFVCTPNRGVLRDMPLLVGASSVSAITDFTEG